MGFGRILGGPADARVQDLPTSRIDGSGFVDYGDRDAGRKPSSAIIIGRRMFIWVRNYGSSGTQARLKYSDNFTVSSNSTWIWAPVILTNFGYPVFVQGAPGDYVYIVAHDNNSAYRPANRFVLLRVPRTRLTDRSAYQFFNGTPSNPSWGQSYAGASRSSRQRASAIGPACPTAGRASAITGGRTTAQARRPTASRSGPARSPGGHGSGSSIPSEWDINPGERGEFPVAWMGSEPIAEQGKLHLLFSGGDRLTIREATIAAGY